MLSYLLKSTIYDSLFRIIFVQPLIMKSPSRPNSKATKT